MNQVAFELVKRSTSEQIGAERPTEIANDTLNPTKYDISRVMAEMGRRGGLIGGKRRLETMTKAQRSKVAKKAAKVRWGKSKSQGKKP